MPEIKSTCCYCGVGCGVLIATDGGRITGVRGDPDHPANFGRLCAKGAALDLALEPAARAAYPELRSDRASARERVSWDRALDYAAEKYAALIARHGPDSVAFYVSGQLLTEDYYVFNKLAKGLIGTNNIDTNSRLCMSSAVSGYKRTLGADAPPACYDDIAHADCLFIAGANMAYAHPVLFRRIEDARRANADLKIIVVDPRRTDTAAGADLFLPIKPGTDVALFNGMLNVMLDECWLDDDYIAAHTRGFAELARIAREYPPATVGGICGVPPEDIHKAARWFAWSRATLSLYCQGLNQSTSGSDKNASLINLHLATGHIGRPGAGPFSLTGQPNAMGGREVGGMANLLSAHRDLANPEHRAEVARLWGIERVPQRPGKTAIEMFEAMRRGEIKAVWIACTNPAQSLPDQGRVREALACAELVVLQETARYTDTSAFADIHLPATGWGEKEGTVTNSERRITRVRAAVEGPGEARADWEIGVDFARRLGARLGHRDPTALFPYVRAEDVFNEHRESTRGRDLDITGLTYSLLETAGPQQWPFAAGAKSGRARLYTDGKFETVDGRARFAATAYRGVAEPTDDQYRFSLMTGRLRDQWHGMARTGSVARLNAHAPEPDVVMHPHDMREHGLRDGDFVRVKGRRGATVLRARGSSEMSTGQLFIAMHWGSRFLNTPGANALTLAATDPHSRQPELKHAAVALEKLALPWRLVVMRRRDSGFRIRDSADRVAESPSAVEIMQRAQPLLAAFEFATLGLHGRDDPVAVLNAAAAAPVSASLLSAIDQAFVLEDDARAMAYHDFAQGISKRVVFEGSRIAGLRLAGDVTARDWLQQMIVESTDCEPLRALLLAPLAAAPGYVPARGRIVCACLDVAESEIEAELAAGAGMDQLHARLKCGTECGTCVPELKRLVARGIEDRGSRIEAMPQSSSHDATTQSSIPNPQS